MFLLAQLDQINCQPLAAEFYPIPPGRASRLSFRGVRSPLHRKRDATPAAYATLRRSGLSRAGEDGLRLRALTNLMEAREIAEDTTLRVRISSLHQQSAALTIAAERGS